MPNFVDICRVVRMWLSRLDGSPAVRTELIYRHVRVCSVRNTTFDSSQSPFIPWLLHYPGCRGRFLAMPRSELHPPFAPPSSPAMPSPSFPGPRPGCGGRYRRKRCSSRDKRDFLQVFYHRTQDWMGVKTRCNLCQPSG